MYQSFKVWSMGKADIRKHSRSQIHVNLAKAYESQSRLSVVSQSSQLIKTTEEEVKMAVLTSCFNIPLTFHDHLSPFVLFRILGQQKSIMQHLQRQCVCLTML